MSCKDCSSLSCRAEKPRQEVIEWRLDYIKLFRLLALISLALAWYYGQLINQPDWQEDLQNLYPKVQIEALTDSTSQFSMQKNGQHFYLSVATENSYGGPLTLASVIDQQGKIQSVELLSHGDTPAYIQKLRYKGYFRQFKGKKADYLPEAGNNWDAVSGATLSSNAIMRANTRAAHIIAQQQFQLSPKSLENSIVYTIEHLLLAILILLSILNIWLSSSKLKLAYVLASVAVVGFMANQMINVGNFSAIFLGFLPSLSENLAFWILLGSVFASIIILGRNIYCGHICPFHGIQYLLHKIGNLNLPLSPFVLRFGRYIPYVGLWAALMVGLITSNPSSGAYEPFSMIFSLQGTGIQWFIMPAVIIGAFFIPDMFCRFFCPAGAMLSLMTNLRNRSVYQLKQLISRK